jgi:hypothetical protein
MATAANVVKLKRSAVAGRVPATTDLDLGELALNTYDGRIYLKKSVSSVESIVTLQPFPTGGTTGQVLTTDNTGTLSWTSQSLSNLIDVDLTTPPTTGQILKYNGTKWVPATEAGASGITQEDAFVAAIIMG